MDQAHFVGKLAGELSMAEGHLWEEISKIKDSSSAAPPPSAEKKQEFFRKDVIARKIVGIILWQEGIKGSVVDTEKAKENYQKIAENYGIEKFAEMKNKEDLVFESEVYYAGHERIPQELAELFRNLERELLEENFSKAMIEIAQAEKSGEGDKADELLKKCQEISKKINEIKNRK
ncbi:MAG: hypothetical protein AAB428_02430 [Patescibacteria group bacterium]